MMRVLIMLRPGRPPALPRRRDSRGFPGRLKLNLGVRIARYVRFAAGAKTIADVPTAHEARLTTREVNR